MSILRRTSVFFKSCVTRTLRLSRLPEMIIIGRIKCSKAKANTLSRPAFAKCFLDAASKASYKPIIVACSFEPMYVQMSSVAFTLPIESERIGRLEDLLMVMVGNGRRGVASGFEPRKSWCLVFCTAQKDGSGDWKL